MEEFVFNNIQSKLMESEKLTPVNSAIMAATVINDFSEPVKKAVIDWSNDKDIQSMEFNGINVKSVMEDILCSDFQALCIIDAAGKNPDIFIDAIFNLPYDEVK